ncbi:MAG: hypothetical protein IJ268_10760 [Proteobacteria bacterium]|nr:hypothetical protein [Pseudomonadota bacterium]
MKKILPILIASACLSTACATTTPAPNPALAIQPQAPEAQAGPDQSTDTEQAQPQTTPGISINDVQDFTPHTAWPDMPADHSPVYNINSGTDDAVWVEGKGYFKGSLDDVYADLTNVMIIGPNHLTEDIVRDEFVETPNRTTYTMHVKMKYVLSIKFDLGAIIDALYDGQTRVGLLYHNEKTAGTTFLKMISTTLVIKQLPDGMFSAEALSLNKATQDKEDEARKHIETLFGYWAIQSQSR